MSGFAQQFEGLSRAWYGASIPEFLSAEAATVIGCLTTNCGFAVLPDQRDAWLYQIELLQECLGGLTGHVFMEFSIPRMGRRIDVVLVIGPVLFVLEFKVGNQDFDRTSIDQVWDYALDLKNFHKASHEPSIIPILVAQGSPRPLELHADNDHVFQPLLATPSQLRGTIDRCLQLIEGTSLNAADWARSSYSPTPTIVEAARALYAQHSVEAIARYDAGAQNLRVTSRRVEELVDDAKTRGRKVICFVTGVPGAGKTLVGLNVATQRRATEQKTHAIFLSGNGPLVAVLSEALTRDEIARQKALQNCIRKGEVRERVKAFIQNVHHFRDDLLTNASPPDEHVAIFDEAQRAWNLQQTAHFMRRKKNRAGFSLSEPEFLISCMDRHEDWAVVVCLVGGGQEINRGEAGIDTWVDAVRTRFPKWDMYISSKLTDTEYGAGKILEIVRERPLTYFDDSLHLSVSMRSFRAENVSKFVKALLQCESTEASRALQQLSNRFPILVTRDLSRAKKWILERARGTERYGLLASSKAHRLKPDAIDIRVDVNPVHWFLNGKDDTRSSYYLEDAATEFQVQGLELDWTCVAWDGDMRFSDSGWRFHHFRGNRWTKVGITENQKYLCNAYRVLLTRARQGMVIYVPRGDSDDPTRAPAYYDATYKFFAEIGIPELQ